MNKASGSSIGDVAKALEFSEMYTGLGLRIIVIGTLTALQWFIYDAVTPPSSPTRDARIP